MADSSDKPDGVILAAGRSSRAGTFKMELDLGGVTLLGRNIELLSPFCRKIVVVGGYRIDRLRHLLVPYPRVVLKENRAFDKGMFSSVQRGLESVPGDCLLCPGDYPAILPSTVATLIQGEGDIRVPLYQGKKGHPVWISRDRIDLLRKQDSCYNLRDFIEECGYTPVPVSDGGILFDIDYQRDFQRLGEFRKGASYEE